MGGLEFAFPCGPIWFWMNSGLPTPLLPNELGPSWLYPVTVATLCSWCPGNGCEKCQVWVMHSTASQSRAAPALCWQHHDVRVSGHPQAAFLQWWVSSLFSFQTGHVLAYRFGHPSTMSSSVGSLKGETRGTPSQGMAHQSGSWQKGWPIFLRLLVEGCSLVSVSALASWVSLVQNCLEQLYELRSAVFLFSNFLSMVCVFHSGQF